MKKAETLLIRLFHRQQAEKNAADFIVGDCTSDSRLNMQK